MKPQVYYFGTLPSGFSSYPGDHTRAFFEEFIKRSKNTLQIVVHREDNLLHYGYVRKISDKNYFGLCICIDRIVKDTHKLMEAIDNIYAKMILQGVILKIGTSGDVQWVINSFVSEAVAIREYSKSLIDFLQKSEAKDLPLPPVDYSIAIHDCIEISFESSQEEINDAIGCYPNVYIAKSNADIERVTSFSNVIKEKNKTISQLRGEVIQYKELIQKILSQKNRYRLVALLSVGLIVLCVCLFFLWNNLNSTKLSLTDAHEMIQVQQDSLTKKSMRIQALQKAKNKLEAKNRVLQNNYEGLQSENESLQSLYEDECTQKNELETKINTITSTHPLIVTDNSFVFSTGRFQFDYYGIKSKYVTLTIKAYGNGKSYENSGQLYVYQGSNSASIYLNKNLDNNVYYYFFLYANNQLIAAGRH